MKIATLLFTYNRSRHTGQVIESLKNNTVLPEKLIVFQDGVRQDEDAEESGEDVTKDDSWDYTAILWNGTQSKAVRAAFEKLTYREQRLLEERNAVCMTCGRVSPISKSLFNIF